MYKRSIFRMSIVINHKDIVVVLGSICIALARAALRGAMEG